MMRTRLEDGLDRLGHEMIEMGAMCEEVIALAATAMSRGDAALAAEVLPRGRRIDQKERDIEALCLRLILQQQPVARDLRQISAALKMITDMERIGDQAEDIAEIVAFLSGRDVGAHTSLKDMAAQAIGMVTDSVEAYVKRDTALAQAVIDRDDVVDEAFLQVKRQLVARIAENPDEGEYALDLLMIAKYLERIGDHATNLAEWVIYAATGVHISGEEDE